MTLKFYNVSALYLSGLGSAYNHIFGFHIRDLKDSGFEKEHFLLCSVKRKTDHGICESRIVPDFGPVIQLEWRVYILTGLVLLGSIF